MPDIKAIFDDPNYNRHNAIEDQINKLEEKKKQLESMIEIARSYNEMDVLPSDFCGEHNVLEIVPYEAMAPLIGKIFSLINSGACDSFWKSLEIDLPSTEDAKKWAEVIFEIAELYQDGNSYKDSSIQRNVEILHGFDEKAIPNSWLKQQAHCHYLIQVVYDDIKEVFGDEFTLFIRNAVDYYYLFYKLKDLESTPDVLLNHPLSKVFCNIDELARNRFTTGSPEVQSEVARLHQILDDFGAFTKPTQLEFLNSVADSIGCKATRKVFDNDRDHGICWFISRAIQIYCKHQQEAMTKEGESNE